MFTMATDLVIQYRLPLSPIWHLFLEDVKTYLLSFTAIKNYK
jgi:hypothetical protein